LTKEGLPSSRSGITNKKLPYLVIYKYHHAKGYGQYPMMEELDIPGAKGMIQGQEISQPNHNANLLPNAPQGILVLESVEEDALVP
jgi:hypothetical protein